MRVLDEVGASERDRFAPEKTLRNLRKPRIASDATKEGVRGVKRGHDRSRLVLVRLEAVKMSDARGHGTPIEDRGNHDEAIALVTGERFGLGSTRDRGGIVPQTWIRTPGRGRRRSSLLRRGIAVTEPLPSHRMHVGLVVVGPNRSHLRIGHANDSDRLLSPETSSNQRVSEYQP
jgi:hypothetical protein